MDDSGLQSTTPPAQPAAPIPTIAPTPPVPPETPQTTPAPGGVTKTVKKHGKKFIVGALMVMLLAGGAWFGVTEVQKRQQTESQAQDEYCTQNPNDAICVIGEGQNRIDLPACGTCPAGTHPDFSQIINSYCCKMNPYPQYQGTICCDISLGNNTRNTDGSSCPGSGKAIQKVASCIPNVVPSPTPSPSPNPSASPHPSASPNPSVACVDLTKDVDTPKVGDEVTFSCEASFSSTSNPVAFFRYSRNGGTSFSGGLPTGGVAVNATTHQASYNITIDQVGDWEVQCRVCTDSTATACTAWGLAQ